MSESKQYKTILADALKATKLTRKAQVLFMKYPNLEEASKALAGILTREFMGETRPLLEEALVAAFAAYDATARNDANPVGEYIIALVSCAPAMLSKRMTAAQGTIAWIPFSEPAFAFIQKHGTDNIGFEPSQDPELAEASTADAKYMLASQILILSDFKFVREHLTSLEIEKSRAA